MNKIAEQEQNETKSKELLKDKDLLVLREKFCSPEKRSALTLSDLKTLFDTSKTYKDRNGNLHFGKADISTYFGTNVYGD